MSHELLCEWFGLPPGGWPPDHYRLLGLQPGEGDSLLIEQRIQRKLDEVRCYQVMHPGPATEAMNRLAQAFCCLTDLAQKRDYDQNVLGLKPKFTPPPLPAIPPPPVRGPAPAPAGPHVWLYTRGAAGPGELPPPPPVRFPVAVTTPPPPPLPQPAPEAAVLPPPEPPEPEPPPPQPAPPPAPLKDPVAESARRSEEATSGLSTRRALYRRISQTRQLLRIWHQLSKYLRDPKAKLSRQQGTEMYRLVEKADEAMTDFPLLGEAGQPGYLILTMASLERATALAGLSDERKRESLARDWAAVFTFLEAHRDFLREAVKKQRKYGYWERWRRAIAGLLRDQPLAVFSVVAGIAAVCIAVIKFWSR